MAGYTVTDEEIIVDRDYTDNFSVKQIALDKLVPKYFPNINPDFLNIGEIGFIEEQIANALEDTFNTSSVLMNESFPIRAVIPESIYSHAAVFQLDDVYTNCAQVGVVIMLTESEILDKGTKRGNRTTFYLDKRTIISINADQNGNENVKDIMFTFDYDIKITALRKQVTGSEVEYNYSANYVFDSVNCISRVNDPYLRIRKTGNGYLLLFLTLHQVERTVIDDSIVNNTKVNFPVKTYDFDNGLAGFDIFYKAPSQDTWVQLEKRLKNSLPLRTPFCYYRLSDEQTLEITFSAKENYFQPEFNSELKIVLYTTLGVDGEFESYSGSSFDFQFNTEKYPYNEGLTIAMQTTSDCSGANTKMDLEALKALTVEKYSSANEISTEHDLEQYFYNYKYRYGNEIKVIKRRDDITERLLSAFILVKRDDYIYPTNTCNIHITESDYDHVEEHNQFMLLPGHVFVHENLTDVDTKALNTLRMIPDTMAWEFEKVDELMEQYPFVYTNPFMISMTKKPNVVGLYQTIANQTAQLDYISSDEDSFVQFITSKVNLSRGLDDSSEYTISCSIAPSSSIDKYIENLNTYEGNQVRMILAFTNSLGVEIGYMEMYPTEINPNDDTNVTFSAKIKTDDNVTTNGTVRLLNPISIREGIEYVYIPITDECVNIYILYDNALASNNKFSPYFDDMTFFSITNKYATKSDPLTFITPMNMMRSTVLFSNTGTEEEPIVSTEIQLLPMVKADILQDAENFSVFIERFSMNYEYLSTVAPRLRELTNLDVKFYNTYGRSANYYIGDDDLLIDRVNIRIRFTVTLEDGADDVEVRTSLISFIKNYIEKVNSDGTNELYISNLIREIENNFSSVHHLKFLGINDYSTDYQTISSKTKNLNELTKEERRNYVPEVLVANTEDILISLFAN